MKKKEKIIMKTELKIILIKQTEIHISIDA
jgi:hypothetical protein